MWGNVFKNTKTNTNLYNGFYFRWAIRGFDQHTLYAALCVARRFGVFIFRWFEIVDFVIYIKHIKFLVYFPFLSSYLILNHTVITWLSSLADINFGADILKILVTHPCVAWFWRRKFNINILYSLIFQNKLYKLCWQSVLCVR